jgi:hypothetical protein
VTTLKLRGWIYARSLSQKRRTRSLATRAGSIYDPVIRPRDHTTFWSSQSSLVCSFALRIRPADRSAGQGRRGRPIGLGLIEGRSNGPACWRRNAKSPSLSTGAFLDLIGRRPTLPHTCACSTIGAEGLNFRVRDGNGWDPFARITQNLIYNAAQIRPRCIEYLTGRNPQGCKR